MLSSGKADLDEAGGAATTPTEILCDAVPDDPGNAITGEQERDPVPRLARDLGVYEKVLEFLPT
jgi:hypothetical protein